MSFKSRSCWLCLICMSFMCEHGLQMKVKQESDTYTITIKRCLPDMQRLRASGGAGWCRTSQTDPGTVSTSADHQNTVCLSHPWPTSCSHHLSSLSLLLCAPTDRCGESPDLILRRSWAEMWMELLSLSLCFCSHLFFGTSKFTYSSGIY